MKILMVSPFLPYSQAKSGAPRAIFDRLQLLSMRHSVSLVTFATPGEASHRAELEQIGVRVYCVTRHESGATNQGAKLWRKRARLAVGLLTDTRPMLVQEFWSKSLCRLIKRLAQRQSFDVVMFEHILISQYAVCLEGADVPLILTEHDIRAAFPDKPVRLGGNASPAARMLALFDRARWRAYARAAYRHAACVLVPTEEDAHQLEKYVPGVTAKVVPFGLAPASPLDSGGSPQIRSERKVDTLLFVGNFDHPPNRDAAHWLCSEIMPLIWRERPHVKLWLVGRNPTSDIKALGGTRVHVWGEVQSVKDYLYKCSLFVAPLREGGGMRIKLLEALAAGTPVVTTTLGASGLGAEDEKHLLIADGATSFARCTLRALGNSALRERLSTKGKGLVSGSGRDTERATLLESALATALAVKVASQTRPVGDTGEVGL